MPIKLTTNTDWIKTIVSAIDCQRMLEEASIAEKQETGEYIRPIILFQAQSMSSNDPQRLTWDKIEKHLLEVQLIPMAQVAVHTGPRKDLDSIIDIQNPDSEVRYIITVSKLKEGWDCPFAYVLCSVADQVSPVAVEQILGRILRMPQATRKRLDALNQSYAYIVSRSFDATAQQLKSGLVEGAGFNRLEADQIIEPQQDMGFANVAGELREVSETLPEEIAPPEILFEIIDRLPKSVNLRVAFNPATRELSYMGPMTRDNRNFLHLGFATLPKVSKIIDRLYAKSNNFKTSAADGDEKPPFIVPMLAFRKQGDLQLFSQEHFLDVPWQLADCDATQITHWFSGTEASQTGSIDVSDMGQVEITFVSLVQDQLAKVSQDPNWTLPRLVNWIDDGIIHLDIVKSSAILFITRAVEALIASGFPLSDLARRKYELRKAISALIRDLRTKRESSRYSALFSTNAADFVVGPEFSIIFDEQTYAPNQPYAGEIRFNKHYTPLVGDLASSGEEFDCAVHLDRHPKVRYWIRNLDRKKTSFWLQLPNTKFYPDMIAMLDDNRILVVEYKGGHLYEGEVDKRHIGAFWAETSGGRCLFCMPSGRDFALIDRTIG